MAVLIKIGAWITLVLCFVCIMWNAYDLVWKDRGQGWRAADLMGIFFAEVLIARVISWLY